MSAADPILFREVQVEGALTDVLVAGGRISAMGERLRPDPGTEVVDGGGGALVPGLHDHHIHLAALASAMSSVAVGPPTVTTLDQLDAALAAADRRLPAQSWIRAVGYHEAVAGPLDRDLLDRLVPRRPVRVQDRSGKCWTLNSPALALVGATGSPHAGIVRDSAGRPTGRIDRADEWLGRVVGGGFPDLTIVGRALADAGVTGVTDCTPYRDRSGPSAIAAAVSTGQLPQAIYLTGHLDLVDVLVDLDLDVDPAIRVGPVKIVLDEDQLPDLPDLVGSIEVAHGAGRSVAVHIVTAATLAFTLAAWNEAGVGPGDRIEHGSVITPAAADRIAALGLTVVTQPGFIAERGDRYLADVDPDEVPHLYRCATLASRGIPVAGSTDAPYTDLDPWAAVRAATERRAPSGEVLGADERLSLEQALTLFTGDPLDPGRGHRRVVVGAPADLCLLDRPLVAPAGSPRASDVRATYRGGVRI